MDNAVAVHGLEAIRPIDPRSGEPTVWRPNGLGMQPEPEMLRLDLEYHSQPYHVNMIRPVNGVRQLGKMDEAELQRFKQWFETTPGWFVIVSGLGGRFSSSPYLTIEAAIVGALSIPALLWRRYREKEALL